MKEAKFSTDVVKTIREFGGWAYKIPDSPILPGNVKSPYRFTPEKPFDIIALYKRCPIMIESKMFKKYEALGERHFRPSQIKSLNDIIELDAGEAFVFLNIRVTTSPRMNRLFIIPWRIMSERIHQENSIKAKELREMEFFESKNKIYNIEPWLKSLQIINKNK